MLRNNPMPTDQPAAPEAPHAPARATGGLPPYRQPYESVIAQFHSDAARGLTTAAARDALTQCGPNELPTIPPEPAWKRFVAQFQNPLTMLLIVATVISFVAWVIEEEGGL